MAKTMKDETGYVNAEAETPAASAEMMEQLRAMQEQLKQQMAELEKGRAELAARGKKKPVVSKAWEEMRTVFLPRAMGREQNFYLVGVNGKRYQVPRGKQIEVPLPIYERLMIMLEMEQKAIDARKAVDEKTREAENVLRRVL